MRYSLVEAGNYLSADAPYPKALPCLNDHRGEPRTTERAGSPAESEAHCGDSAAEAGSKWSVGEGELYTAEYESVMGSGKKDNPRVRTPRKNTGANDNLRLGLEGILNRL